MLGLGRPACAALGLVHIHVLVVYPLLLNLALAHLWHTVVSLHVYAVVAVQVYIGHSIFVRYFAKLAVIKAHINAIELLLGHICICLGWIRDVLRGVGLVGQFKLLVLDRKSRQLVLQLVDLAFHPLALFYLIIPVTFEQTQLLLHLVHFAVQLGGLIVDALLVFFELLHLGLEVIHVDLHLVLQTNMSSYVCL